MEENETRILPTVQDKWVSLHQYFGLICWCDNEQLRKEFKNLNNINFLYFGELTTQEKQMLQDKVSVLFRRLGLPSLSEVMTREAIYHGESDSSSKTSLVRSMAESGSTKEQMEFLITNTQRLLKLPSEESQCILSMSSSEEDKDAPITNSKVLIESNDDQIIEEIAASTIPSVVLEEEALKDDLDFGKKIVSFDMSAGFTAVTSYESGLPYDVVSEVQDNTSEDESANKIIECIQREEFGLDSDISAIEDSILKKQHARLGRALHCLSQELYSQDSHFRIELVQNADDNMYPCYLEPTLTFILQETGVLVLNNEQGFLLKTIKHFVMLAIQQRRNLLLDILIKRAFFKSVFWVTDTPEILSNGFHIKFDISDGQIGFVLPTIVPPCDVNLFSKLITVNNDSTDEKRWNTCIVLPFRSMKNEAFSVESPISMFSNLHPSL